MCLNICVRCSTSNGREIWSSMNTCHFVKSVPLGLEEALVCAAKRTSERRARCPAVLQEPAVAPANQNHQPQPLRAGNWLTLISRMFQRSSWMISAWSSVLGGRWLVFHKEGAGEQLRFRPEDGGTDLVPGGRVWGGHEPLGLLHLPPVWL